MDEHQGSAPCIPVWKALAHGHEAGISQHLCSEKWNPVLESHQPLRFCKPPPELIGQRDSRLRSLTTGEAQKRGSNDSTSQTSSFSFEPIRIQSQQLNLPVDFHHLFAKADVRNGQVLSPFLVVILVFDDVNCDIIACGVVPNSITQLAVDE